MGALLSGLLCERPFVNLEIRDIENRSLSPVLYETDKNGNGYCLIGRTRLYTSAVDARLLFPPKRMINIKTVVGLR